MFTNTLKYLSLLIKILYLSLFIIALKQIKSDHLIRTMGSSVNFFISQCALFWFYSLFYKKSSILNLIKVTVLFIIICHLALFIKVEIIYLNIIPLIIELFILRKMNHQITKSSLCNYHDAMLIMNYLFLGNSMAMLATYTKNTVYFIIAGMLFWAFIQNSIIFALAKKFAYEKYAKMKKRKIIIFFLATTWFIPNVFSVKYYSNSISIRFDLLFLSILLAIYPMTLFHLFIVSCQNTFQDIVKI